MSRCRLDLADEMIWEKTACNDATDKKLTVEGFQIKGFYFKMPHLHRRSIRGWKQIQELLENLKYFQCVTAVVVMRKLKK